ncbi:MAG: gliding motility-associated ABC transporter substrate-binding protein GldG [Flavobacteriaceae bacterium]
MKAIISKDFRQFLNSGSGPLIIGIYLLFNSLILWFIPNPYNILQGGFADLDSFFELAPWFFIVLIPIISMRIVSEENSLGTLEMLKAQPISNLEIVGSKLISIYTWVLIALSPILVYTYSISELSLSPGEIDWAVLWGSFLGLNFLLIAFTSISVWISLEAKTNLISLALSILSLLLIYSGFEFIDQLSNYQSGLSNIGIYSHYLNISKGLIDISDLTYFLGIAIVFIALSLNSLNHKKTQGIQIASIGLLMILLSFFTYFSLDLTKDKRFTLSSTTLDIVHSLVKPVEIKVYLDGEFPSEFKRLQTETQTLLSAYRDQNKNIRFEFVNPKGLEEELIKKGLQPSVLTIEENGILSEQTIFPYAEITSDNKKQTLSLLTESNSENQIEASVQNLEYAFSEALDLLNFKKTKKIAVLSGNGQSSDLLLYDFLSALGQKYFLAKFTLDSVASAPSKTLKDLQSFDLIINSNPVIPFSEAEKFVLDQYQVSGGNAIHMISGVQAALDSLMVDGTSLSYPLELNLTDLFFTYGFRQSPALIKDYYASDIPLATGNIGKQTQYQTLRWPYHNMAVANPQSMIGAQLNFIQMEFSSPIELLQTDVQTQILLQSSNKANVSTSPGLIELNSIIKENPENYNQGPFALGVLIQGQLPSAYELRTKPFKPQNSKESTSKLIFISDGKFAENKLNQGQPLPLDQNPWNGEFNDKKTFLLNAVDFLCGQENLLVLRTKHIDLYPLNKVKAYEEGSFWKLLNTLGPLLIFIFTYFIQNRLYQRKYQS